MNEQFLVVTVDLQEKIKWDELKSTLDKALDWVQYMPNSFILRTNYDPNQWYTEMKRVFGAQNQFLIAKIDISQRQGWLSDWVWDWIIKNETRAKQAPALERQTEQETKAGAEMAATA